MSRKRFVVLDRDGTIIAERNYLRDPDEVELLPGAAAGLKRMKELGLGLAVVTNQSGLGRGYFDEDCLHRVHERLRELLHEQNVELDGVYYCPHTPDDGCECRKPRTKMILDAAAQFQFQTANCFVIGDKPCDIELGERVGATTLLVRTGYGRQYEQEGSLQPDHIVDDLDAASRVIEKLLPEHPVR